MRGVWFGTSGQADDYRKAFASAFADAMEAKAWGGVLGKGR